MVDEATGTELMVGCSTCHSMKVQEKRKHDAAALQDFHKGLTVKHGKLGCTSCHGKERPDQFHLATGDTLTGNDVMPLCSQCHGPQKRDYDRGSHGGMNGHWDRSKARTRNHCVDCHDPHVPAIGQMKPVLPPAERRPLDDKHVGPIAVPSTSASAPAAPATSASASTSAPKPAASPAPSEKPL